MKVELEKAPMATNTPRRLCGRRKRRAMAVLMSTPTSCTSADTNSSVPASTKEARVKFLVRLLRHMQGRATFTASLVIMALCSARI